MARVIKQIIEPQFLNTSIATLYTVPENRTTVITRISFTNTSGNDRFVNLWLVPNGGSASNENKIVDNIFVAVNETFSPSDVEGQAIPAESTIQGQAQAATSISIVGSGTEVTN